QCLIIYSINRPYTHTTSLFPYTTLFRSVLQELEVDPKRTSPRSVLSAISHAKSEVVSPEAYARDAQGQWQETIAKAFVRYNALLDRKSTRLNSSHVKISYAVLCLKKKKV